MLAECDCVALACRVLSEELGCTGVVRVCLHGEGVVWSRGVVAGALVGM